MGDRVDAAGIPLLIRRKFVLLAVVCWKNSHSRWLAEFSRTKRKRVAAVLLCARAVPQTRFAFAINNFVISLAAGPDSSVPPCFLQIMALRFSFALARLCKYCERMRPSEECPGREVVCERNPSSKSILCKPLSASHVPKLLIQAKLLIISPFKFKAINFCNDARILSGPWRRYLQ